VFTNPRPATPGWPSGSLWLGLLATPRFFGPILNGSQGGRGRSPSASRQRLAQRLPANQAAPERKKRLVDVGPFVIPYAQAAKLIDPGKRALDAPPPPAPQATPTRGAAHGQPRHDMPCPQSAPNRRRVVTAIAKHAVRPLLCSSRSPSSCASICQEMPLRRTKTIPVRHAGSGTRGRPPFGRGGELGRSGSTRSHSASGISGTAIPSTLPPIDRLMRLSRARQLRFCYALLASPLLTPRTSNSAHIQH